MRDKLNEGEWLVALNKGLKMIVSCREKRKSPRTERVIISFFRNLVKMSPFDYDTTMKQIDISLEHIGMRMTSDFGIKSSHTGRRYGREV